MKTALLLLSLIGKEYSLMIDSLFFLCHSSGYKNFHCSFNVDLSSAALARPLVKLTKIMFRNVLHIVNLQNGQNLMGDPLR